MHESGGSGRSGTVARRALVALAAWTFVACSSAGEPDAGAADAGGMDAARDAARTDAGLEMDASDAALPSDTGPSDAPAAVDLATIDAPDDLGSLLDAGPDDAGPDDAGPVDAGYDFGPPGDGGPADDTDHDGLSNAEETSIGTSPANADTDGDGVTDLEEVTIGTDPLDGTSTAPSSVFFVELPYLGGHTIRTLDFETTVSKADVYFIVDTTSSMSAARAMLASSGTIVAASLSATISDVTFGSAEQADFPDSPYGTSTPAPDVPFHHAHDLTSGVVGSVFTFVGAEGGDEPDAQLEAVYLAASGASLVYPVEGGGTLSVPATSCPVDPTDGRAGVGAPCFRPGALPIVVQITDSAFHGGVGAPYAGAVGAAAHTLADATAALGAIGAQYVGINVTGTDGAARADEIALATATGAVGPGGPVVFDAAPSGVATVTADAVTQLAATVPRDVTFAARNTLVPPNPGGFDATRFVLRFTTVEGFGPSGETGAMPGVTYDHRDATTFYGTVPGTRVRVTVELHNDAQPSPPSVRAFRARLFAIGHGVAELSERDVVAFVPPDGVVIVL